MNSKLRNINWVPPNNGSEELKKLTKLNFTKQKLMSLMENISKEIEQTNLEWIQMKSILNPKPRVESVLKPKLEQEIDQRNIDDEAVNTIELDLSVGNSNQNRVFFAEEDDYDDEF